MAIQYWIKLLFVASMIMFLKCSCTEWQTYHVVRWNDAFFLPDGNIGLISWEYEEEIPSSAWESPRGGKSQQKIYSYNRTTKEMTLLGILADNENTDSEKGACRSGNFVAFKTNYKGNTASSFGLFDLAKKEVVGKVSLEPGVTRLLYGLSENGRILLIGPGPGKLYDFDAARTIWEQRDRVPFYLSQNLELFIISKGNDTTCWRLLKTLDLGKTDYDTSGCFGSQSNFWYGKISSDQKFFQFECHTDQQNDNSSYLYGVGNLDSLLQGKFVFQTFSLKNYSLDGDYQNSTGNIVYTRSGNAILGNVSDSIGQFYQYIARAQSIRK